MMPLLCWVSRKPVRTGHILYVIVYMFVYLHAIIVIIIYIHYSVIDTMTAFISVCKQCHSMSKKIFL